MLSLPPDAPIATRLPRVKRFVLTIVAWISDSKAERKQGLQSFWWVLGRDMRARAERQDSQSLEAGMWSAGGMVVVRVERRLCVSFIVSNEVGVSLSGWRLPRWD